MANPKRIHFSICYLGFSHVKKMMKFIVFGDTIFSQQMKKNLNENLISLFELVIQVYL